MNAKRLARAMRAFLVTVSLFCLAAPHLASAQRFDGVVMRIATYGGPWKDGMQAQGKLSEAQRASLAKRPLKLDFEKPTDTAGPAAHIMVQIK